MTVWPRMGDSLFKQYQIRTHQTFDILVLTQNQSEMGYQMVTYDEHQGLLYAPGNFNVDLHDHNVLQSFSWHDPRRFLSIHNFDFVWTQSKPDK
jgi:hypothetical protein